MAQLLAPYNNAMRLGQGFNSYTQQICIDKAVAIDPNWKPTVVRTDDIRLGTAKRTATLDEDDDSEPEAYELLNRFEEQARIDKIKQDKEYAENKVRLQKEKAKRDAAAEGNEYEDTTPIPIESLEDNAAEPSQGNRKYHGLKKQDVVKGNFNYQEGEDLNVHPWVKPQIVTYTSKFVDKLSDVTGTFHVILWIL